MFASLLNTILWPDLTGGSNPAHVPAPYVPADLIAVPVTLSMSQKARVQALLADLEYECADQHNVKPHPFCPICRHGDRDIAEASLGRWVAKNPGKPLPEFDEGDAVGLDVLDWQELWDDDTTEEWILEPLLPARRGVALFSQPKLGKALLMLEVAAGLATGKRVLGVLPDRAYRVLYLDFENDPKGDIKPRLEVFGYDPWELENLFYVSFPAMAKLDTANGGNELMSLVEQHEAEIVVIDTVSRAVAGEENSNDTWLDFYRHTGMKLKQAGVSYIRLDHSGKDPDKGMRGGSAKYGDVDAVWQLTHVAGDMFELACSHSRLPITEKGLIIERTTDDDDNLIHKVNVGPVAAMAVEAKITELVATLDRLGVDRELGRDKVREVLKEHGVTARNNIINSAIHRRRLGGQSDRFTSSQSVPDLGDRLSAAPVPDSLGTGGDRSGQVTRPPVPPRPPTP